MRKIFENPLSKLKRTMNGLEKGVYSFGIITAENPMGEKFSSTENKERQQQLKNYLREGLYQYILIRGKYGNLENPVAILNINIDDMFHIGTTHEQESFIYARNYFDYVKFAYWKQKGHGNFKLLDTSDYYVNKDDVQDFYTYKNSWKFNIPFSIFEGVNHLYTFLHRDLNEKTLSKINSLVEEITDNVSKTLKYYYTRRGMIQSLIRRNQPIKVISESYGHCDAYWVSGNNVYELDGKHIRFIMDSPDLFDITKEEIIAIFKKHGEKIGIEGKAREEIIKRVAKDGWLRVRHYMKPENYWSIQCDMYKRRKYSIHKFIDYAIENLNLDLRDSISILGYDDNYSAYYPFQKGGVSEFLVREGNSNARNTFN